MVTCKSLDCYVFQIPVQSDENAFLSDLAQPSWSNINSYEDPSAAVQFFNDTFLLKTFCCTPEIVFMSSTFHIVYMNLRD